MREAMDDQAQTLSRIEVTGLRYVESEHFGLRRRRQGRGFIYVDDEGRPLRDEAALRRIKSLAIPPAWESVWICPDERGHIQATGRDAKGRKQYRYHPEWSALRNQTKFERLAEFGAVVPRIRRRVAKDLRRQGLPHDKIVALAVRLLESTLIRVGNEEYTRSNASYGLTTLRSKHVRVNGTSIQFRFRAKSGKLRAVSERDARLARLVRRCQELPGQELFQYLDENGEPARIDSRDVNTYLQEATAGDFSAKDFRTWAGTVGTIEILRKQDYADTTAERERVLQQAVREITEQLGNTVAIAKRYYIHPDVLESYRDGSFFERLRSGPQGVPHGLDERERWALRFLRSAGSGVDGTS